MPKRAIAAQFADGKPRNDATKSGTSPDQTRKNTSDRQPRPSPRKGPGGLSQTQPGMDLAGPAVEARSERSPGRKGGAEGERGESTRPEGERIGRGINVSRELTGRLKPRRGKQLRGRVGHDRWSGIGGRQGDIGKMADQPGRVIGMLRGIIHTWRPSPVPMKHGDFFTTAGVGMPAKKVVMKLADLPSLVLMAHVVELHLRPGSWQQRQDQQADREGPGSMMSLEPMPHQVHQAGGDSDHRGASLSTIRTNHSITWPRRVKAQPSNDIGLAERSALIQEYLS